MTKSFLEFRQEPRGPFQHILIGVWNTKGQHLGWISWFKKWNKFVFNSSVKDNVFDAVCLEEILNKLKEAPSLDKVND